METQISQWGNSLGLRIPKAFAQTLGFTKDARAHLDIEDGRLVITPVAEDLSFEKLFEDNPLSLAEFCKNMTPYKTGELANHALAEDEIWDYEE